LPRRPWRAIAVIVAVLGLIGWNWLNDDQPEPVRSVDTTAIDTSYGNDDLDQSCGPGQYYNVDGDCISGPVHAVSPPPGASAQCFDGTYSFSEHRQGTCSHHGGVSSWL
jgi:hypothetical protein